MSFVSAFSDELIKVALNKAEKMLFQKAVKDFMGEYGVKTKVRFKKRLSKKTRKAFKETGKEGRIPLGSVRKNFFGMANKIEAKTNRPKFTRPRKGEPGYWHSPQHALFHEGAHAVESTGRYVDKVLPFARSKGIKNPETIADNLGAGKMTNAINRMVEKGQISPERAKRLIEGRPPK